MNKVFIFTLGAAVGSLLTWKFLEKKYKDIADEEIESVREYFRNKEKTEDEYKVSKHYVEVDKLDNTVTEYTKQVNDLGYTKEKTVREIYVEPGVDRVEPYVISPDEFGEVDIYDTKNWTYYSDSVLTDEDDQIVVDPELYIGDALSHFGEYEDDSVFVRNENTGCDYEILKYETPFSDLNPREDY